MIGSLMLFASAGIFLMQSQNIGSAITEVTALVIALGGIATVALEYFGRKKEAAESKRWINVFGQKSVEWGPRIQKLYEVMKRTGQVPTDTAADIEYMAKQIEQSAKIGNEQLEIFEGGLKPKEKADSLVIPRENFNTKPIPKDPKATPQIQPKKV
jgi:hypothetical protein